MGAGLRWRRRRHAEIRNRRRPSHTVQPTGILTLIVCDSDSSRRHAISLGYAANYKPPFPLLSVTYPTVYRFRPFKRGVHHARAIKRGLEPKCWYYILLYSNACVVHSSCVYDMFWWNITNARALGVVNVYASRRRWQRK
jgi:hypothetical protein